MLDKILAFIAGRLASLKTKVFVSGSFKGTVANAWEYTGTSITVPNGHIYLVYFVPGFSTGKPIGVGLHTSDTIPTAYGAPLFRAESENANDALMRTPLFVLGSGTTYYYFEKRATVPAAANTHTIAGFDLYN